MSALRLKIAFLATLPLISSLAAAQPLKPEHQEKVHAALMEGEPFVNRLEKDERREILRAVLVAKADEGQFTEEQLAAAAGLLKEAPAERLKAWLGEDSPLRAQAASPSKPAWDGGDRKIKLTLADLAPKYDWVNSPAEARLRSLPLKNPPPPPPGGMFDAGGLGAKFTNSGNRNVGVQFLSADNGKTMSFDVSATFDAQGRPSFSGNPRFPQLEQAIQNGINGFFGIDQEDKPLPKTPGGTALAPTATSATASASPVLAQTAQAAPAPESSDPLIANFRARPLWNPGQRTAGAVLSAAVWGAKVTAQGAGRLNGFRSAGPESRLAVEKNGVTAAIVSAPLDGKALVYQASTPLFGGRFGGEYNALSGEKALNSEFSLSPGATFGTQAKVAPGQQSLSVFLRITDLFK